MRIHRLIEAPRPAPRAPAARMAAAPSANPWRVLRLAAPNAWLAGLAGLVVMAMLLPLLYLVLRATAAGPEAWRLLLRGRTLGILGRSVGLAATVTGAATLIAVPLGWLTMRTDLPGRRAWSVLTLLPLAVPTYVGGYVLVAALGPRGLLQQALAGPLGLERLPTIYGFPGAALALTLFTYPYLLLAVRSALQGLDPAMEEASRTLGQGAWTTFRRVTLPQLRPAIASGALLVALYTLSDFGAVSLLQFDTFTRAVYLQYQGSFDRSMAALLALLLVALSGGLLFLEARLRGRARYCASRAGASRRPTLVRLGSWRWPALAFCAAVVLCALVLPLAVLGYWLVRSLSAPAWGGPSPGAAQPRILQSALNSAHASALAALAAVAAALPVAILAARRASRAGRLLEGATHVSYALPGVVVALALVFFGANYLPALYQTLALLVVGYVIRFLPQALGATRASLLQVSPRLEEAARTLGAPPARVVASITLPLVRPGMIAGLAMVFLTTMKELPVTLLLSPIGFRTLSTTVWTATSEGFMAEAAPPALALVLVSGLSMALLLRTEARLDRE